MKRCNALVLIAIVFVSCSIPALCASTTQAQEATLEQLFAQALRSDGVDYVNARKAIVERKAKSLPFLKSKRSDKDWHARVLAEAMIGWVEDPEQYAAYESETIWAAGSGFITAPNFYDQIRSLKRGFGPYASDSDMRQMAGDRYGRKQTFGVSRAPFLVELALKGNVLERPTVRGELPPGDSDTEYTIADVARILNVCEKVAAHWMRSRAHFRPGGLKVVKHKDLEEFLNLYTSTVFDPNFREKARCWAMLWLGDCFNNDPVTIPLLVELLQSNESTKIRGYAALALGITGKEEAIEPLKQAKNDADKQVKDAVEMSIGTLQRIMEFESKKKAKD